METRVLRYFLAVARERSLSRAAGALHVTQPTLSRQMMELEERLGTKLFLRGRKGISLTAEGLFFRRRAEEILELVDRTAAALRTREQAIGGEIWIGGGETEAMRLIARAARNLRAAHPLVSCHLYSGNAEEVAERLDRGLLDFGLFVGAADLSKYEFIALPVKDVWGLLLRRDSPLAARRRIRPADLAGLPLLCSRQQLVGNELAGWLGGSAASLSVVATYNLLYNASLMVEEGVGHALCLDGIIKVGDDGPLCFRPLEPALEAGACLVWKKGRIFSRAAAALLEQVRAECAAGGAIA